jgi:hypothetical protein
MSALQWRIQLTCLELFDQSSMEKKEEKKSS